MEDGCSINVTAGTKLNDYLGLLTPSIKCTVHSYSSIKVASATKLSFAIK